MTDRQEVSVPTGAERERNKRAWGDTDDARGLRPRKGRNHVGCLSCGFVTTVPSDDLLDSEEMPWCAHVERVFWRQRVTGSDWTRMVRVDASVRDEFGCQILEAQRERVEASAREAVDALNFYESTLSVHKKFQMVHVLAALRQLRDVLGDA